MIWGREECPEMDLLHQQIRLTANAGSRKEKSPKIFDGGKEALVELRELRGQRLGIDFAQHEGYPIPIPQRDIGGRQSESINK